jgi:hypothetical protein
MTVEKESKHETAKMIWGDSRMEYLLILWVNS